MAGVMAGDVQLSRNLRRLMCERGMSVRTLTKKLCNKKSGGLVYAWLNCERNITLYSLRRLKAALGCTWDELLGP